MDDKNKNFIIIEDLTIKDNNKVENNEEKENDSYNNKMDSLFKELDYHINQIKDLYNLEYKEKNKITISKQVNINYNKRDNLFIREFNNIRTDKIIYRILNDKTINYKNSAHKRTQSSFNMKSDISIELKGQKKKSPFEITKFNINIKNQPKKDIKKIIQNQNFCIYTNQVINRPNTKTKNESINNNNNKGIYFQNFLNNNNVNNNIINNDINFNNNGYNNINNNNFINKDYNNNFNNNLNINFNNNNINNNINNNYNNNFGFNNNFNNYNNYNNNFNNINYNTNFNNNNYIGYNNKYNYNNNNNQYLNYNHMNNFSNNILKLNDNIINNSNNNKLNSGNNRINLKTNNRFFSQDKNNTKRINNINLYSKEPTINENTTNNKLKYNYSNYKNIIINKDKTIEEEPNDINTYDCKPFYQILNNCKERSYLWELFPQEIAANQLEQSGGTCYMVSALESLSHVPKLLNYIFDTNFASDKIKFQINFRQNDGVIEHYIVKNNFPTEQIHNLKFMKPLEKEAYGIIFEKVWAVVRGGYNKLDKGYSYKVLNKVLGTNCNSLYNKNMGIFTININAYYNKMINDYSNNMKKMSYNDLTKKIKEKQDGDIYWQQIIKKKDEKEKIDPKTVFELIKNSQKNDGAIITASINMSKDSAHAYSVLGTFSKKNLSNNSMQDFVIIKNPWRKGNDIEEKIDIIGIENQIKAFREIIEINKKHYNTGVFYMPREYFEKWFRNIVICKPDYQKYFPEVFNALNLYREIADYYRINSKQYFFDVAQGQNLIKTEVISKEKYESLLKLIQNNKSEFTYAYDKNTLSTIWYDEKYMHSLSDSVFVKDTNSILYNIKKADTIKKDEFYKTDVYKNEITFIDKGNKVFSVIKLTKVNRFEDLCQIKNLNKGYNYSYYSRGINPLNVDIAKMDKFKNEIIEFLRKKYNFVKTININNSNKGWINCFPGINLESDNYEDEHYHIYYLGKNNKINLFESIGKKYKCSCYYIKDGKTIRYCNKYFTFTKKVFFYNFTYYIDGVKKTTQKDKCDYYNLEIEKIYKNNIKSF